MKIKILNIAIFIFLSLVSIHLYSQESNGIDYYYFNDKVIVEMKNGEKHIGLWRNSSNKKHIKIREVPGEKLKSYARKDIACLKFISYSGNDTTRYVTKSALTGKLNRLSKTPANNWFREEYIGKSLSLYSLVNRSYTDQYKYYYAQFKEDAMPTRIATLLPEFIPYKINIQESSYKQLAQTNIRESADFFRAYPELAGKIRNNKFMLGEYPPISLIKEWENMYNDDGKLINRQDEYYATSGKIYNKPATVRGQINLNLSVSPIVSPIYTRHIGFRHDRSKTNVPPLDLSLESCFLEFPNLSSFSTIYKLEYSAFNYESVLDDLAPIAFSERIRNQDASVYSFFFGFSYNYHLAQDFEVYLKACLGYTLFNVKGVSVGDNLDNNISDFSNRFIYPVYLGARYYFSDNWGVFIEGGYLTSGYFATGISLRLY